jgi:predicted nucleic-acid-binding Zn-ribbon protein
MNGLRKCPECESHSLYITKVTSAGHSIALLPGLGGFLRIAKFDLIVCANCGLTRFYAEASAREKLSQSPRWRPL